MNISDLRNILKNSYCKICYEPFEIVAMIIKESQTDERLITSLNNYFENNENILFCSDCKTCVHKSCFEPESLFPIEFVCNKKSIFLEYFECFSCLIKQSSSNNSIAIECELCKKISGFLLPLQILKTTKTHSHSNEITTKEIIDIHKTSKCITRDKSRLILNSSNILDDSFVISDKKIYCHPICAFFNNAIYIDFKSFQISVENIYINNSKQGLCYFCGTKGYNCIASCDCNSCDVNVHYICFFEERNKYLCENGLDKNNPILWNFYIKSTNTINYEKTKQDFIYLGNNKDQKYLKKGLIKKYNENKWLSIYENIDTIKCDMIEKIELDINNYYNDVNTGKIKTIKIIENYLSNYFFSRMMEFNLFILCDRHKKTIDYCYCKNQKSESNLIQCDYCSNWLHSECDIGCLIEKQYKCEKCIVLNNLKDSLINKNLQVFQNNNKFLKIDQLTIKDYIFMSRLFSSYIADSSNLFTLQEYEYKLYSVIKCNNSENVELSYKNIINNMFEEYLLKSYKKLNYFLSSNQNLNDIFTIIAKIEKKIEFFNTKTVIEEDSIQNEKFVRLNILIKHFKLIYDKEVSYKDSLYSLTHIIDNSKDLNFEFVTKSKECINFYEILCKEFSMLIKNIIDSFQFKNSFQICFESKFSIINFIKSYREYLNSNFLIQKIFLKFLKQLKIFDFHLWKEFLNSNQSKYSILLNNQINESTDVEVSGNATDMKIKRIRSFATKIEIFIKYHHSTVDPNLNNIRYLIEISKNIFVTEEINLENKLQVKIMKVKNLIDYFSKIKAMLEICKSNKIKKLTKIIENKLFIPLEEVDSFLIDNIEYQFHPDFKNFQNKIIYSKFMEKQFIKNPVLFKQNACKNNQIDNTEDPLLIFISIIVQSDGFISNNILDKFINLNHINNLNKIINNKFVQFVEIQKSFKFFNLDINDLITQFDIDLLSQYTLPDLINNKNKVDYENSIREILCKTINKNELNIAQMENVVFDSLIKIFMILREVKKINKMIEVVFNFEYDDELAYIVTLNNFKSSLNQVINFRFDYLKNVILTFNEFSNILTSFLSLNTEKRNYDNLPISFLIKEISSKDGFGINFKKFNSYNQIIKILIFCENFNNISSYFKPILETLSMLYLEENLKYIEGSKISLEDTSNCVICFRYIISKTSLLYFREKLLLKDIVSLLEDISDLFINENIFMIFDKYIFVNNQISSNKIIQNSKVLYFLEDLIIRTKEENNNIVHVEGPDVNYYLKLLIKSEKLKNSLNNKFIDDMGLTNKIIFIVKTIETIYNINAIWDLVNSNKNILYTFEFYEFENIYTYISSNNFKSEDTSVELKINNMINLYKAKSDYKNILDNIISIKENEKDFIFNSIILKNSSSYFDPIYLENFIEENKVFSNFFDKENKKIELVLSEFYFFIEDAYHANNKLQELIEVFLKTNILDLISKYNDNEELFKYFNDIRTELLKINVNGKNYVKINFLNLNEFEKDYIEFKTKYFKLNCYNFNLLQYLINFEINFLILKFLTEGISLNDMLRIKEFKFNKLIKLFKLEVPIIDYIDKIYLFIIEMKQMSSTELNITHFKKFEALEKFIIPNNILNLEEITKNQLMALHCINYLNNFLKNKVLKLTAFEYKSTLLTLFKTKVKIPMEIEKEIIVPFAKEKKMEEMKENYKSTNKYFILTKFLINEYANEFILENEYLEELSRSYLLQAESYLKIKNEFFSDSSKANEEDYRIKFITDNNESFDFIRDKINLIQCLFNKCYNLYTKNNLNQNLSKVINEVLNKNNKLRGNCFYKDILIQLTAELILLDEYNLNSDRISNIPEKIKQLLGLNLIDPLLISYLIFILILLFSTQIKNSAIKLKYIDFKFIVSKYRQFADELNLLIKEYTDDFLNLKYLIKYIYSEFNKKLNLVIGMRKKFASNEIMIENGMDNFENFTYEDTILNKEFDRLIRLDLDDVLKSLDNTHTSDELYTKEKLSLGLKELDKTIILINDRININESKKIKDYYKALKINYKAKLYEELETVIQQSKYYNHSKIDVIDITTKKQENKVNTNTHRKSIKVEESDFSSLSENENRNNKKSINRNHSKNQFGNLINNSLDKNQINTDKIIDCDKDSSDDDNTELKQTFVKGFQSSNLPMLLGKTSLFNLIKKQVTDNISFISADYGRYLVEFARKLNQSYSNLNVFYADLEECDLLNFLGKYKSINELIKLFSEDNIKYEKLIYLIKNPTTKIKINKSNKLKKRETKGENILEELLKDENKNDNDENDKSKNIIENKNTFEKTFKSIDSFKKIKNDKNILVRDPIYSIFLPSNNRISFISENSETNIESCMLYTNESLAIISSFPKIERYIKIRINSSIKNIDDIISEYNQRDMSKPNIVMGLMKMNSSRIDPIINEALNNKKVWGYACSPNLNFYTGKLLSFQIQIFDKLKNLVPYMIAKDFNFDDFYVYFLKISKKDKFYKENLLLDLNEPKILIEDNQNMFIDNITEEFIRRSNQSKPNINTHIGLNESNLIPIVNFSQPIIEKPKRVFQVYLGNNPLLINIILHNLSVYNYSHVSHENSKSNIHILQANQNFDNNLSINQYQNTNELNRTSVASNQNERFNIKKDIVIEFHNANENELVENKIILTNNKEEQENEVIDQELIDLVRDNDIEILVECYKEADEDLKELLIFNIKKYANEKWKIFSLAINN